MPQDDIPYGAAQTVEELGHLARAHRKQRHLPDAGDGLQAQQPEHALAAAGSPRICP